eukprot:TRINITY_DN13012_c0_g2_i2.p1 TRINITY_DN13012_c0_g2~~TRINITY_DN13012_c0_g2_i2.p1  ORF type:complete len:224 (+),score=45.38 TRINITY_DN13012_c0_g2_i2:85-756(+)
MADDSMSSVESSNSFFGEGQLECNKHDVPMNIATARRIQNFYHANPSTVVNIRADSSLYMSDDMRYNRGIHAKNEALKLRTKADSKPTRMNPYEFKMFMQVSNTSALQSSKLGDYVDPYYDDPGDEISKYELGMSRLEKNREGDRSSEGEKQAVHDQVKSRKCEADTNRKREKRRKTNADAQCRKEDEMQRTKRRPLPRSDKKTAEENNCCNEENVGEICIKI